MSRFRKPVIELLICAAAAVLSANHCSAQTTIFNTPSTDVTAAHHTYVEFDFISHLEKHINGGFQVYVPRVVLGAGKGVELGLNVAFTDTAAPDQPVELQPNAKWQFFSREKLGLTAVVGGIGYLPTTHRAGTDSFGMTYTSLSKKFNSAYGPRFSGGAYGLIGRQNGTGARAGVLIGYEQPLHPKVSILADWFSGRNRFGYAGALVSVAFAPRHVLMGGYSVGNQGRKNNALTLIYGLTF